jgi:uncharacterized protein (TIGR02001 family)
MMKKTLIATVMLAGSSAAMAEITANIAASSDYFFRGVSQTSGSAAISGGLDYTHESGIYLGTWMSNVDFAGDGSPPDAEVDFYGGYAAELDNGLGYDIGALYYYYPGDYAPFNSEWDYAEVAASVSYSMFSAGLAYTVYGEVDNAPFDDGDIYYHVDMGLPLPDGFELGAVLGYYDFNHEIDNSVESYTHWSASLSKDVGEFGSFSVNYEQTDDDNNDDSPNFWVGWSKEF